MAGSGIDDKLRFIPRQHAVAGTPPHVPEISLHLADRRWIMEADRGRAGDARSAAAVLGLHAWAGGQALARPCWIIPETVAMSWSSPPGMARGDRGSAFRGRSGCAATEDRPFALVALRLQRRHERRLDRISGRDVLGSGLAALPFRPETVLLGDVFLG